MNIYDLIAIVKKKIKNEIIIEKIDIEDKSFLHKNHLGHQEGKFHLKLIISSTELRKLNRIGSNKRIYKVLDQEMKKYIHSLQILIS
jgi:BolA protein|tara:strand:- start:213 stop:473 length:261 start_codon:yes stop_codon:yes gene_type:complete